MTAPTEQLLSDEEIFAATKRCIEAWNSLDVEATLQTYTEDVDYRDPAATGTIQGRERLRRYLTKFFKVWDMQFRVLEDRRIAGANAQVCVWEVDITPRDGSAPTITEGGMDLIHVRGNQLSRDHAYMDRLTMTAGTRKTAS
ncbi:nuclear transport factor 2 family protein [Gordonia polyisoprenivorans]|uniref:nuclear transport factor 2 family protein n=1 Tax=Gordonia polyisoprenivorans TaxID=84595 RepID=UPI001AD76076|nr:nuclear transport factor 2 family protein [Gordonia polyisoprenivorans]QTI69033.1 nuclear transport factor 2 family protein [Gordonia polyisoprenivorans]